MKFQFGTAGIVFGLAMPSVSLAAAPLYFDIEGSLAVLCGYVLGAVMLFGWLVRGQAGLAWKALAAVGYFVLIPGYPFAEKAYITAQAERQRVAVQAEREETWLTFCRENLTRESPLDACKRRQSSDFQRATPSSK